MSDHTVTVEFEADGMWPTLRFRCQASQDARCRNMCALSECEEGCVDPDVHPLEPIGYCNEVEWLTNDDEAAGSISGRSTEVILPIDISWGEFRDVYDGPTWRIAPLPTAPHPALFDEAAS